MTYQSKVQSLIVSNTANPLRLNTDNEEFYEHYGVAIQEANNITSVLLEVINRIDRKMQGWQPALKYLYDNDDVCDGVLKEINYRINFLTDFKTSNPVDISVAHHYINKLNKL